MNARQITCTGSFLSLVMLCAVFCIHSSATAQEIKFDRESKWNGYDQLHFQVANRAAYFVAPKHAAAGHPWVWRARFPNFHAEMDIELLGRGFHVAYVDVAELFGSPTAMAIGDAFYKQVTTQHGFAAKPAMEGVSRGGLFVYNWAVKNPDKVACIYCDTPVLDFKSWPAAKMKMGQGKGLGSIPTWKKCLAAYEMNEEEALAFGGNPVNQAKAIAASEIPLLHIVSESDRVVPPIENTYLLQGRLKELGYPLDVISVAEGTEKSNGHHFTHLHPERVVDFVLKHTVLVPDRRAMLASANRIVFLGDSITYGGGYVAGFEAWLLTQDFASIPKVINVGLPSETVSGLSEDGHAGGRFPRPDLAERLDRVLAETKPDLVFACYGINCGIYQPFDELRFAKFKLGMESLRSKVEAAGAKLIHITPPTFDDDRKQNDFSYDEVMDKYARWLVSQRESGWKVIDLHSSMAKELKRRKADDPEFTFQPDAVHANAEGHWFIASQLIDWFGDTKAARAETPKQMLVRAGTDSKNPGAPDVLRIARDRMNILKAAYLSKSGHLRPGIKAGLPIEEAEQVAAKLTAELEK